MKRINMKDNNRKLQKKGGKITALTNPYTDV